MSDSECLASSSWQIFGFGEVRDQWVGQPKVDVCLEIRWPSWRRIPHAFRCPHAGWASACRRAASRTRSRAGHGHGRRVGWAVRAQARWRRQVYSGTPIKARCTRPAGSRAACSWCSRWRTRWSRRSAPRRRRAAVGVRTLFLRRLRAFTTVDAHRHQTVRGDRPSPSIDSVHPPSFTSWHLACSG
jgi:hypothetical protein